MKIIRTIGLVGMIGSLVWIIFTIVVSFGDVNHEIDLLVGIIGFLISFVTFYLLSTIQDDME